MAEAGSVAVRQLRIGSLALALSFGTTLSPEPGLAIESDPGPGGGVDRRSCALLNESWEFLRAFGNSRLDCEFALPESDVQLALSYSEQEWHFGSASHSNRTWAESSDGSLPARSTDAAVLLDRPWATLSAVQSLERPLGLSPAAVKAALGLKGRRGRLKYWADYQLFRESRSEHWAAVPRDHSFRRLGGEFSLGALTPSLEFAQVRKPTANSRDQAELSTSGKLSLAMSVPRLPLLTLTYAREWRETASSHLSRPSSGPESETVSGTLWYGRSRWDAYLTSTYSWVREPEGPASTARMFDHILGGSYQLTDTLTISPILEVMQFVYPNTHYWMEMRAAYLGAYYVNSELPLNVSFYGSYVENQDSAGSLDSRSLDLSLAIERELDLFFDGSRHKPKAGLKMVHSQYGDRAYADSDVRVTSVFLTFEYRR